ncbi:hypothetical protein ACK8HY_10005 [Sphingobacterium sp. NGMCC 1.201703]|uniref:hypothetical protein n=1 Tax=Sphingobacterium sp. NGMCC 1.201703 TaxID=3388657 RepID=UPI0039FC6B96
MKIYLVLLFIITGQWSYGQLTINKLFALHDQIANNHPENYQFVVQELNKLAVDSMEDRAKPLFYQLLSSHHAALGDYERSRFYWDQQYAQWISEYKITYDTIFYKQHQFVDAKNYILQRSKREQVVMINEAHNIPYHRAFVLQLLKGYRQLGFKYLAIETLLDDSINTTQQVTDTTGFYSREPLFAEMIREALQQHFVLIKYEADENTATPRMRDSLQAANLASVLKNDPDAKILVYAGYDHIQEETQNKWKKMAHFFREMTNIDPLTISQSKHIEQYHPELETAEFRTVHKFGSFNDPVVALKNDTAWHDKFVDISIFYPRYLVPDKRPTYLTVGGLRKAVTLRTRKKEQGLFVQAFYANEKTGHRIPADQIFIKKPAEQLYLRPGKYMLEFKNSNDKIVKKEPIQVVD